MEYRTKDGKTYRMSSTLNEFQKELYIHLIEWKWKNITKEPGTYKGQTYDYMFPEAYKAEFSPIINGDLHSELTLLQKSKFKFKEHIMAYHMASSQCACINLFMTILLDDNANEILKHTPGCPADFKEIDRTRLYKGFCFEYWGQDIKQKDSRGLLLDHTQAAGTDSDVAIAYINHDNKPCIWLIEHKLAEKEFTCCGGYKSEHNSDKGFCRTTNLNALLENNSRCRYTAVGYNYWELTQKHDSSFIEPPCTIGCPFLDGRNQLWRNQLLALALVDSSVYTNAHFSVVHHRDNTFLNPSMEEYRKTITAKTSFTSFTNADLISSAEKNSAHLKAWCRWYKDLYML